MGLPNQKYVLMNNQSTQYAIYICIISAIKSNAKINFGIIYFPEFLQ